LHHSLTLASHFSAAPPRYFVSDKELDGELKGTIELRNATTALCEKNTLRVLNAKNSDREWVLVADGGGSGDGAAQAAAWATAINQAAARRPKAVSSQWEVVETMPAMELPRVVPKKKKAPSAEAATVP
jgi:hypothetical protein